MYIEINRKGILLNQILVLGNENDVIFVMGKGIDGHLEVNPSYYEDDILDAEKWNRYNFNFELVSRLDIDDSTYDYYIYIVKYNYDFFSNKEYEIKYVDDNHRLSSSIKNLNREKGNSRLKIYLNGIIYDSSRKPEIYFNI